MNAERTELPQKRSLCSYIPQSHREEGEEDVMTAQTAEGESTDFNCGRNAAPTGTPMAASDGGRKRVKAQGTGVQGQGRGGCSTDAARRRRPSGIGVWSFRRCGRRQAWRFAPCDR